MEQDFSTSPLWTWRSFFIAWRSCPVHCTRFDRISHYPQHFYPLDSTSTPSSHPHQLRQSKMSPDIVKCSLGPKCPSWEPRKGSANPWTLKRPKLGSRAILHRETESTTSAPLYYTALRSPENLPEWKLSMYILKYVRRRITNLSKAGWGRWCKYEADCELEWWQLN